ncbi:(Fe-S)-binding protein [Actinomycetaceae bacterium MB13-C1-2]|nr:(Fe-S)-binding protein [Actinomycetaceae bacterium MB13-C1-2]
MAQPAVLVPCAMAVAVLTVVGVSLFVRGIIRMVRLIAEGAPESGRFSPLGRRVWMAVEVTLLHSTFKGRPLVRAAHWMVMVSFVALILTLVTSYGQVFDPLFSLPLIGHTAWWGWFTEIMAALGLLAILALIAVRLIINARHRNDPRASRFFGSTRWQAKLVEATVAVVCAAVLIGHAITYAVLTVTANSAPSAMRFPLTAWLGSWMVGASVTTLANWLTVVATIKISMSMVWMIITGIDVAMGISWHRFLAPVNIMTTRNADGSKALGALSLPLVDGDPSDDLEQAAEENPDLVIGLGSTSDLTWKDRLDVLSCTECGRCQDLCPAWNTEKPLSPKLLVMAMRDSVVSAADMTMPGQALPDTVDVLGALSSSGATGPEGVAAGGGSLVPGVITPEVLWDCTMCGACVDQCPVDIDHIDHISNLRRYQFLMESAFPRELSRPMRAMETKQNPYNQSARKRLDWAKNLDFDVTVIGEDTPDATELDYLFWVGCAGAYDEKAKKTTAAVAELLHVAGVSFGVLGSAEGCTGDPARRAGNEVLFQLLARASIDTLNEVKAQRIVVTCAHCFNSVANEFPQLGGKFEVIHHTQLLNRLLREGKLTPMPAPEAERRKITYHDPCFLGRHNGVFEAPRELLGGIPELELVEMGQNRERAMCCGAGGAHAWMEESSQGPRIASVRMGQAQETGATTIATACPFCTQMLGSAPTSVRGSERDIEVKDVALLLLEGVHRDQQGTGPRQ